MADTITDNRTLLTANNAADADLDDLTGSPDTGSDDETFIFGTESKPLKVSQSVDGLLHDAGSAQDWSTNTFYIWYKCTSVTDTLANGGVRIRFCGNTVTDWFEKFIDGGGIGTIGGWTMAVVDIEKARADAVAATDGGTNGTTPATSAIRYVGIVFDVPGMISGNTDNCFVDAMWRLPATTPGIIVQGQDQTVSAHDWTWQDIVDAGDVDDTSKAWGSVLQNDGVITLNTPIRFGTNDATTHGFSDTNIVVAWQDNLVADDLYELDIIGGSGVQSWTMGIKTGSGDTATGAQGLVMVAESTGVRYNINANDANLDAANFYGCQFLHGADFVFDDIATSVISSLFNDCTSALVSNALDFLRCSIVNANTGDGVAFITTDDLSDIVFCTFEFSDGHAIELTTPRVATQASKGNLFTGYALQAGNANDRVVFNNTVGAVTINVSDSGDSPSFRNGASASTVVNNTVTLTVHVEDADEVNIEGSAVYLQKTVPTKFTSGAGNTAGDTDLVVTQTIDVDIPGAGTCIVLDISLNVTLPYRYVSHDGSNTFTFPSELTGSATSTGSSISLISTTTDFLTVDIEEGDTIRNTTDGSFAVVDRIIDADNITTSILQGGSDNTWESSDAFSVHRLATTLVSGTDQVDVPIINSNSDGFTNASGDVTKSFNFNTNTDIIVRVRKNSPEDSTRYVQRKVTGQITSAGVLINVTLQEDEIAI